MIRGGLSFIGGGLSSIGGKLASDKVRTGISLYSISSKISFSYKGDITLAFDIMKDFFLTG
tara:strand:- start:171 stop:353 length:183 start_codon:yes stop_codon:yes gene_type:complete